MADNASTRKDVRAKEKAARQADVTRGEVITALMSQPAGREYVWDRLAETHVFATSFSLDALGMAFSEGERNTGLRLLDDILEWCPDLFISMIREHRNGRRTQPQPDAVPDAESFADAEPEPESGGNHTTGADVYN